MQPKWTNPILVLGESLIDVVDTDGRQSLERVGGSGANAAIALSRLGNSVWFASAVGPDEHGRQIRTRLEDEGIRWATNPETLDHTGLARARIDRDGHASYHFDIDWPLSALRDDIPAPVALQVSSLAPTLLPGAHDVLTTVRRYCRHALVAYDVNMRPAVTGTGPEVRAAVEEMIALSDVVKFSDEDLTALYPRRDEALLLEYVLSLGPVAVVITRGDEVAQSSSRTTSVTTRTPAVPAVDTIGAGDTFGAAMLDGLVRRKCMGINRAGGSQDSVIIRRRHCSGGLQRRAAITCSRVGADPPFRREMIKQP